MRAGKTVQINGKMKMKPTQIPKSPKRKKTLNSNLASFDEYSEKRKVDQASRAR